MEIWYHIGILAQQSRIQLKRNFNMQWILGLCGGVGLYIYAEGRGRMGSMVV